GTGRASAAGIGGGAVSHSGSRSSVVSGQFVHLRPIEHLACPHTRVARPVRRGVRPAGRLRRALAPSSANHTADRFQFITGSAELAQSVPFDGPTLPVLSAIPDGEITRREQFLRARWTAGNSWADSWVDRRNTPAERARPPAAAPDWVGGGRHSLHPPRRAARSAA